jgi:uncharacterized protein YutE (UPF0331/DUF86 family)
VNRLAERLAELRRHLDHLREIRPRVTEADDLLRDLTLHNDVLFSLLTVCQMVVDIAGELAARRGLRFETYTEGIRSLADWSGLSAATVRDLAKLPGFRNVLVHEYVGLDFERVMEALDRLGPVEEFVEMVRRQELDG